jgi:hypothetical protein
MKMRTSEFNPIRSSILNKRAHVLITILGITSLLFSGECLAESHSTQHAMPSEHQAMVHEMGHEVMPFDLSKTLHIFEMTESGGIQQVVTRAAEDAAQVALIQQHLQHEALKFSNGDYSDPSSLHGAQMPGLKELAAGASKIKIEYSALPNGAQISFATQDIHLITAIHRWFGAQLSDHGADATYR